MHTLVNNFDNAHIKNLLTNMFDLISLLFNLIVILGIVVGQQSGPTRIFNDY